MAARVFLAQLLTCALSKHVNMHVFQNLADCPSAYPSLVTSGRSADAVADGDGMCPSLECCCLAHSLFAAANLLLALASAYGAALALFQPTRRTAPSGLRVPLARAATWLRLCLTDL